MKTIILFLLVANAWSFENFPVYKITEDPDRFAVFQLHSTSPYDLTLDCASFLFGVTIEDSQRRDFFHLYEQECYQVAAFIYDWTEVGDEACLKVDLAGKDWRLEKGIDDCE